jgi:hypothetical protein
MSDINEQQTTNEEIDEALYTKDFFDEELTLINNELDALDDLYTEVKTHYDGVKNSITRGSLTFVEKQTTNLVGIKTAKLNYIKLRSDLKRNVVDFGFKDKQIKAREGEDSDRISEGIYKRIMDDLSYNNKINQLSSNEISDEDVDAELEKVISDNNITTDGIIEDYEANTNFVEPDEEVEETIEEDNNTEEVVEESDSEETEEEIVEEQEELIDEEEAEEESDDSVAVNHTIAKNGIIGVDTNTGLFYELDEDYYLIKELGHIEDIADIIQTDDSELAIGDSGSIYISVEM